jgi:hypothetical protein
MRKPSWQYRYRVAPFSSLAPTRIEITGGDCVSARLHPA